MYGAYRKKGMHLCKKTFFVAMVAAAALSASASAQVLQVGAVGSSAMFQTATIEAYQLAGGVGSGAGYYTGKNAAQINDQRGDANIVPQVGNLAVVWDNAVAPTKVWY